MIIIELEILPQSFSICKVRELDPDILVCPFVFLAGTDREHSIICPTDMLPQEYIVCKSGWRAFRVAEQMDFSLVGVLARLSNILAEENIPLCAVSTFNTDYLFVKEEDFSHAKEALRRCFTIL